MSKKQECFAYMDAHNNQDAPDGAWQAMLEDAVEMFNEDHGTNFDSHDMFIEWAQRQ